MFILKNGLFTLLAAASLMLTTGCETEHYLTDARHPEIHIKADGSVTYRGRFVDPEDLPDLLKDSGLTKEDTINIHIPEDLQDYRMPRKVMGILSHNGFSRPILLSDRKAYSQVGKTALERRREQRNAQRQKKTSSSSR